MDLSHRALIVDDEQDILNLLERVLAKMKISSCSAASFSEAKQRLANEASRIDFCITDMRLPDGNGIELVKKISTDYPDIPVAMITAYGSEDVQAEARMIGIQEMIAKPFTSRVIEKTLARLLQAGP